MHSRPQRVPTWAGRWARSRCGVRRTKGGSVKRSRLTISKLLAISAAVALLASGCGGPKVGTAAGQAGAPGAAALGSIADRLAKKAIFGGNEQRSPGNGTPVSIGNVSTLSGVLGELFSPVVPALKTFVASQNACGGLNGHPIKLTIADDQGDPSTAVTEGRRLVKDGA